MKKILLVYWTGTFNTRYTTNLLKTRFESLGYEVTTLELDYKTPKKVDVFHYDLIGVGYPIYGFNIPHFINKWLRHQQWNINSQYFFYKDSGETMHANDASSYSIFNWFKRHHIKFTNEYHFVMPYNIHFRFEDNLIREMLEYNDKLADIIVYEVTNKINNIKKYKFIHKFITFFVRLVYICGPINSFLYRVDKNKCNKCGLCVNSCPRNNIYFDKNNRVRFHHHCESCMRCCFMCPKDAYFMGFLQGWKVNGKYDLENIKKMPSEGKVITKETRGFFECYIETFDYIDKRYKELFKK
ncbi:MAG: EFR1 family ferrodoxin [Bacilli bacterium]|nr:EFR1 family ferrodoxin [Bacilli bacterium]